VLVLQLAGWLTLLLLVSATVWSTSRQLTDVARARQEQLAVIVAQQIDRAVARDLARIQVLSGSRPAQLADSDLDAARAMLADAFHRGTLIKSIRLIDRGGQVVLKEPTTAAESPLNVDLTQAFNSGGISAVSIAAPPLRA
jgi:hypothetical protein